MKQHSIYPIILLLCFILTCNITNVFAHPGRTDKYGGHMDNSTGQYHYHNDDGTITIAPRPQENKSSSTQKSTTTPASGSNAETTNKTENDTPKTTQVPSSPQSSESSKSAENTITVDGSAKSLQENVQEKIQSESTNDTTPDEPPVTSETTQSNLTPKNSKNYIAVSYTSPFLQFCNQLLYLLFILALIGFCTVSALLCKLFRKLEKKNNIWGILLHVPYILFLIPGFIGDKLFTLYLFLSKEKM